MPRISNIELIKPASTPILFIRAQTRVDNLPRLIGESYGKIVRHLQDMGELMSGVPFVLYHNMDMQNLDVEMGFPVAKAMPGKDDIQCRVMPEGKAVMCMYIGEYTQLESTYEEMIKWIKDNALEPDGTSMEYYYNGPGFPPEQLLTQIVMPLK